MPRPTPTHLENDQKSRRCSKSKKDYKSHKNLFGKSPVAEARSAPQARRGERTPKLKGWKWRGRLPPTLAPPGSWRPHLGRQVSLQTEMRAWRGSRLANHQSEKLTPGSSLNIRVAAHIYLHQTWTTQIATPHPNPSRIQSDQKSRRCSRLKKDYEAPE